jgi:hypothetical protein
MARRKADQPDLFETAPAAEPVWRPEDDPEYMASIRRDLYGALDKARRATRFPWRNFTDSAVAEILFEGKVKRLPPEEGEALSAAFAAELDRLYALCEAEGGAARPTGSRG